MNRRGNMLIAVVFLLFIFFVGAGLISFTLTHIRIMGARTIKTVETGKLFQQQVYYLHHFREEVFSGKFRDFITPETEYFNLQHFPVQVIEGCCVITPSFFFQTMDTGNPDFNKTRVTAVIDVSAEVPLSEDGNRYHLVSGVSFDILSGKIPLSFFPFLLESSISQPAETYLKEKKVANSGKRNMVAGEVETDLDFSRKVNDTFNIPGSNTLVWQELREKLGLEPSDQPVEDGIYLVVEGSLVRAVFIQGDVERMIFFISGAGTGSTQGIRFVLGADTYQLKYIPGSSGIECWDTLLNPDFSFLENIIVNGSVLSVEQEGEAAFHPGSNITLLVSAKAVIRSDLETGKPALNVGKVKLVHLTLAVGFQHLFRWDGGIPDAGIVVDTVGPANLEVSAVAAGKFSNQSSELNLTGSLYCTELENNGNIEITQADSAAQAVNNAGSAYFSTVDFKYICKFLIHYIEEVSDE
jgi:hypothetical protein